MKFLLQGYIGIYSLWLMTIDTYPEVLRKIYLPLLETQQYPF